MAQRTTNHGVSDSVKLGRLVWLGDRDLVIYAILKFPPSVFRFMLVKYCPESWNGLIVSRASRERLIEAKSLHPSVWVMEGQLKTHPSGRLVRVQDT